jgi:hypothetical protein
MHSLLTHSLLFFEREIFKSLINRVKQFCFQRFHQLDEIGVRDSSKPALESGESQPMAVSLMFT